MNITVQWFQTALNGRVGTKGYDTEQVDEYFWTVKHEYEQLYAEHEALRIVNAAKEKALSSVIDEKDVASPNLRQRVTIIRNPRNAAR